VSRVKSSISNFDILKLTAHIFLTVKRRLEQEAKTIIEQGVSKCTPNKRKSLGIYENLFASDDIRALLGETSLSRKSLEVSPSAPPMHQNDQDLRSNSSLSTAEATDAYFAGRKSHGTLHGRNSTTDEEFTFTDSVLDELAYNK
jgi:hypothetical protein